jgi:hypothetical protein
LPVPPEGETVIPSVPAIDKTPVFDLCLRSALASNEFNVDVQNGIKLLAWFDIVIGGAPNIVV